MQRLELQVLLEPPIIEGHQHYKGKVFPVVLIVVD